MCASVPYIQHHDNGQMTIKGGARFGDLVALTASRLKAFITRCRGCPEVDGEFCFHDRQVGSLKGAEVLWQQVSALAFSCIVMTFPELSVEQQAEYKRTGIVIQRKTGPRPTARPVTDALQQVAFMFPGSDGHWLKSIPSASLNRLEQLAEELAEAARNLQLGDRAQNTDLLDTARRDAELAAAPYERELAAMRASQPRGWPVGSTDASRHDQLIETAQAARNGVYEAHGISFEAPKAPCTPRQLLSEVEQRVVTAEMAAMAFAGEETGDTQQIVDYAFEVAAANGWIGFPTDTTGTPKQQLARVMLWCHKAGGSDEKTKAVEDAPDEAPAHKEVAIRKWKREELDLALRGHRDKNRIQYNRWKAQIEKGDYSAVTESKALFGRNEMGRKLGAHGSAITPTDAWKEIRQDLYDTPASAAPLRRLMRTASDADATVTSVDDRVVDRGLASLSPADRASFKEDIDAGRRTVEEVLEIVRIKGESAKEESQELANDKQRRRSRERES